MPGQTPKNDPTTPDLPKVPGTLHPHRPPRLGPVAQVPDNKMPKRGSTS